jgi:hypothetical protein
MLDYKGRNRTVSRNYDPFYQLKGREKSTHEGPAFAVLPTDIRIYGKMRD